MAELGLGLGASAKGRTVGNWRAGIRRAPAVFGMCDGVIVPMLDTDRQRVSEYTFPNNEAYVPHHRRPVRATDRGKPMATAKKPAAKKPAAKKPAAKKPAAAAKKPAAKKPAAKKPAAAAKKPAAKKPAAKKR